MTRLAKAPPLLALLLLAACGEAAQTQDGVTAKERQDLDNAAAMVEDNQVFDTSPDSLVLEGDAAAASNAPEPAANGSEAR